MPLPTDFLRWIYFLPIRRVFQSFVVVDDAVLPLKKGETHACTWGGGGGAKVRKLSCIFVCARMCVCEYYLG